MEIGSSGYDSNENSSEVIFAIYPTGESTFLDGGFLNGIFTNPRLGIFNVKATTIQATTSEEDAEPDGYRPAIIP